MRIFLPIDKPLARFLILMISPISKELELLALSYFLQKTIVTLSGKIDK